MASISKQPKELQDRHRKILMTELKKPENRECADCRTRNPTWASINLGVFLCIRCSGLHRQVGVHVTKVRSCTMDLWDPEQIQFMLKMGNANAKRIWEHQLPPDYGKPAEDENDQLVMQWIRTKYEKRKFMHPNPEAVLMQINQEYKDREMGKAPSGGGGSGGLNRGSKATATAAAASGSLARKAGGASQQQQQQQQSSPTAAISTTVEGFAPQVELDNNIPASFGGGSGGGFGGFGAGGGGFNFGGGDEATNNNNSSNGGAGGGGGAVDMMEQLRRQQEMLIQQMAAAQAQMDSNQPGIQQQPQQQQQPEEAPAVSFGQGGFAFVAETTTTASSNANNNAGGGGFSFVSASGESAPSASTTAGGFSFINAGTSDGQTSPLSLPAPSSDAVVDALFSETKPGLGGGPAIDFTRFVSASPAVLPLSSSQAAEIPAIIDDAAAPKKKTEDAFDPFSVLAKIGELKYTAPASPVSPDLNAASTSPNRNENEDNNNNNNNNWSNNWNNSKEDKEEGRGGEANSNGNFFSGNNNDGTDGSGGGGFGFMNHPAGFGEQQQDAMGDAANPHSADSLAGGEGGAAPASEAEKAQNLSDATALMAQLQKQQELLMQQMAAMAARAQQQ